jgi:hypothetical protein
VDEEQSQIASFSLSSNVKTAIPFDPSDEIKAEYGHWLRRAIEAGAEGSLLSCSSHTQRIESRLRRDKSHYQGHEKDISYWSCLATQLRLVKEEFRALNEKGFRVHGHIFARPLMPSISIAIAM